MKIIEERAKEYASKKGDISLSAIYNEALASIYEEAYIAGAEEQKAIDNERAILWLRARNVLTEDSIEVFRQAMEE